MPRIEMTILKLYLYFTRYYVLIRYLKYFFYFYSLINRLESLQRNPSGPQEIYKKYDR